MTDKIKLNSTIPQHIGRFEPTNKEYMQFLYLPIKFLNDGNLYLEPRLEFLRSMVEVASCDIYRELGSRFYTHTYCYLTVKQTLVPKGLDQNRPGWHSDGFGTSDVQYIFFDKWPTEFMIGNFEVSADDAKSMEDFDRIGKKLLAQSNRIVLDPIEGYFHQPNPFYLYRIDQNHIHRTVPAPENGVRMFVKITFSEHKYAQGGNSHNYEVHYDWSLSERSIDRNQPHK